MTSGRIFNVQRFSIHDGPGVRTTVFFKGCPGRCFWCHNPESQSPAREVIRLAGRCIGCGACAEVCPLAADGRVSERVPPECRVCGACVGSCPTGARQILGRDVSIRELLAEVLRDRPFFEESDGGVTFSGGEPLRQPAFLISALEACKDAGLHTALDTCGYGRQEDLLAAAELSDVVLFDLKHSEARRHFEATGLPLEPILDNLRALSSAHGHVWLRLPIVPGFNDGHDDVERAAELAAGLPSVRQVNLLPYHRAGTHKLRGGALDRTLEDLAPPPPERLSAIRAGFEERGLLTRVGG
jgi:pyruvate formate lyase activating enzyme